MNNFKSSLTFWYKLTRPQTLPLSLATVLCGNGLAFSAPSWRVSTLILTILTASSLQILSNIANDYGDGIRGTDTFRSTDAPPRFTTTNNQRSIQIAIALSMITSVLSGLFLLYLALDTNSERTTFLLLGGLSILAAITYTIGRHAYGYYGLGEASVFIFFGIIGVGGNVYLQSSTLPLITLIPATSCGLLCAAVLHINNMRDIITDRLANKHTLAARLGLAHSKTLHLWLLSIAATGYVVYGLLTSNLWLYPLMYPYLIQHARRIHHAISPNIIGRELKILVQITFYINLLFAASYFLPHTFNQ